MIEAYCGVANSNNFSGSADGTSELDIALGIGKLFIQNDTLENDLIVSISKENCREGMQNYLKKYSNGRLVELANQINDHNDYLNLLKEKC